MLRKITLFFLLLLNASAFSQIINEAPYILTVDELKNWSASGNTADPSLIATEPLASRFIDTATQLNPNLSNNLKIAYLPDGMNNFANYGVEQSKFNLYNFTHWSYIDTLVWFGGTASQTVQLPSAPWANAAHKNGVKVLGNIFFAPVAFGGATSTILNFLEQDASGDFVVIPILVNIMQYYNFDGWFINQETDTNGSTARLMQRFLGDLTAAVEAVNKEVMWYDAMLLSGQVSWQNRLNANNSPFLQDDADGNPGNGFEKKVSSSIFINFNWPQWFPNSSNARAKAIGRSEFDVFTGVDLWPGRNQLNFESGGNIWMNNIHLNATTADTSLGLFATNCVYNNSRYSSFNSNANDYENFYSEERHMFAGADRNPNTVDNSGFRGYSNWVPATSTITTVPFETNFNTGHGLKKFEEGQITSNFAWHNMNDQDLLPSWQFAFSDNDLSGTWDFDTAYNGGSSLNIGGTLVGEKPIDLKLYKTKLLLNENSKVDITYNYQLTSPSSIKLLVSFPGSGEPLATFERDISPNGETGWITRTVDLSDFAEQELSVIGLKFESSQTIMNYSFKLGHLKVHEDIILSTENNTLLEDSITITYPTNNNDFINILTKHLGNISANLYNVKGQLINRHSFNLSRGVYQYDTSKFSRGIYLLKFTTKDEKQITKKIIIK